MTTSKATLKTVVRGMYDLQKLRIQMGNRVVGNFKVKLGQEPSTNEKELSAEAKLLLIKLRASYKKITDGVKDLPTRTKFVGDGVIDTYSELQLMDGLITLEKAEARQVHHIGTMLKDFPIWTDFMEGIRGIGPMMAGVIISEIDIAKARHPSSLWAYCGVDVAGDGAGRSKKEAHLVECKYTNKAGEGKTRMGITFNPFVKTKLVGVLMGSFIKAGNNKYAEIYYAYKNRLENHAVYGTANDEARKEASEVKYAPVGHRHNMAARYAIKMFLIDLYAAWRAMEGLPVSLPYHEAKLALAHGQQATVNS